MSLDHIGLLDKEDASGRRLHAEGKFCHSVTFPPKLAWLHPHKALTVCVCGGVGWGEHL